MKQLHALLFSSLSLLLAPANLLADPPNPSQTMLTPEGLFNRCYSGLTGKRAAHDNPLLVQVRNAQIAPVDACMTLFDRARLVPVSQSNLTPEQLAVIVPTNPGASYTPFTLENVNDTEAISILNRFQNFHRQFFQIGDLSKLPAHTRYLDRFNDATEPALYLTRLLFQPGIQYREAVTGNYSVRGIRSLGPWTRNYFTGGSSIHNMTTAGTGLDRGDLIGIGAYGSGNMSWFKDDGGPETTFSWTNGSGQTYIYYTFNARRSYGGGILGLHSYIVMNSGFPTFNADDPNGDPTEASSGRSNASRRMMRRLTASVLQDILGRPLPALRPEDVAGLVANYLQNPPVPNQLPFRTSSNCSTCHVALDPLAAAWRPFYFDRSYFIPWILPANAPGGESVVNVDFISAAGLKVNSSGGNGSNALLAPETPLNGEFTMMGRDPNFHRRPASSDVRFRSYDGTLVWQHITATGQFDGLPLLGDFLATTNDLYVNIAARYFKFFTGIEVSLHDMGASGAPTLSADDLYYRNVVIELGLNLKNHQSLRQLVQEIFNLSLYQKVGMRDLKP